MINNIIISWYTGHCFRTAPKCLSTSAIVNLDDSLNYKKAVSEVWLYKYCLIPKVYIMRFLLCGDKTQT
jgi:predicted transglutaminase-like protease